MFNNRFAYSCFMFHCGGSVIFSFILFYISVCFSLFCVLAFVSEMSFYVLFGLGNEVGRRMAKAEERG